MLHEQAQSTQQRSQTDVKWFPLYSSADAPQAAPSVRVQSTTSGTLVEVTPSSHLEAGEEVLRGWLLDASAIKAPLQQLLLDWTSERDGFQRFSIEASDDLQHWQAWGRPGGAAVLADERIEQREVSLPGQSARYLRLLWQSPQSAPVLNAAQLVSSTSSLSASPLAWSQPLAGSTAKSGEYLMDVAHRRAWSRCGSTWPSPTAWRRHSFTDAAVAMKPGRRWAAGCSIG